jgi:hypothetical protein
LSELAILLRVFADGKREVFLAHSQNESNLSASAGPLLDEFALWAKQKFAPL